MSIIDIVSVIHPLQSGCTPGRSKRVHELTHPMATYVENLSDFNWNFRLHILLLICLELLKAFGSLIIEVILRYIVDQDITQLIINHEQLMIIGI